MVGLIAGMFVLLAAQNLSGTWLNLYVTVHDTAGYDGVFPAMFDSGAGGAHAVLGLLIGVNALLALARTWRWPDPRVRAVAGLSLVFVVIAAYAGFHFVQSAGDPAYSFAMEFGFVAVVLCQATLLYLLRDAPPAPMGAASASAG